MSSLRDVQNRTLDRPGRRTGVDRLIEGERGDLVADGRLPRTGLTGSG
ncbi:hypothetical protein [Actinoplanes philippinensis]|nr:hypothetical protein [Actinoplanes philippinensis]